MWFVVVFFLLLLDRRYTESPVCKMNVRFFAIEVVKDVGAAVGELEMRTDYVAATNCTFA